ncbi:AAA ATPase [Rippkaea orientalis PCC 8801]|uniref:AAA ATPase n=1 Tax=Rippkaea orientalis (strain PCC 8801 / RF-1) TaxID=41431 RepID=B7JVJ7_RIPO1|nr:AAA family ATPase [Rippkaea orientalis]ACK64568.1 AAA ATPase [Rippkaea orientalis PCC 8801]
MKVESITIQNFKRFDNIEVSFKNKTLQEVTNRFLILGDNGTGKTTLLQAIALPLALATKKIQTVSEFDWVGFLPGRFWIGGSPHIELEISFEDEELEATKSVARRWYEKQPVEFRPPDFVEPGNSHLVKLTLNGEYWKVGEDNKLEERSQFQGRYYAQRLMRSDPSVRSEFSRLPGIFWFDQFRNLGSNPLTESSGDGQTDHTAGISFDLGVGRLRQYLIQWDQKRRTGQNNTSIDYLKELQIYYTKVFPERSFSGVEYQPSNDSPTEMNTYFTLYDGHRTYDIVEMSAGEQAVFPMLYEIVRQQISYSIVLVDEIDLNLHPPAAQLLVNQLPKIAPTCQFLFTTHSEAVNDVIGEEETYRLPGGSLCL